MSLPGTICAGCIFRFFNCFSFPAELVKLISLSLMETNSFVLGRLQIYHQHHITLIDQFLEEVGAYSNGSIVNVALPLTMLYIKDVDIHNA